MEKFLELIDREEERRTARPSASLGSFSEEHLQGSEGKCSCKQAIVIDNGGTQAFHEVAKYSRLNDGPAVVPQFWQASAASSEDLPTPDGPEWESSVGYADRTQFKISTSAPSSRSNALRSALP
jgi:hypothetical protein